MAKFDSAKTESVRPDDQVDAALLRDGRTRPRARPGRPVATIVGLLAEPGTTPRSMEDLNEAAADGWSGNDVTITEAEPGDSTGDA